MWKLLGSVISGFLLLRDFFGYLIPGAVFLFLLQVNPVPFTKNVFGTDDRWLVALTAVVGSYVTGHVLVAIGYAIYDAADFLKKTVCEIIARSKDGYKPQTAEQKKKAADAAKKEALASQADILLHRYLYPALFNELDRRATINILRIGLGVALFAAGAIALWLGSRGIFIAAPLLGIFMLWNGYTGKAHVRDYGKATILAGQLAVKRKVPFFRWNAPGKETNS